MNEFERLLNELDQLLEESWSLPMMGGKCIINREDLKACLDGLHTYYPTEIAKARSLLEERERILQKAKNDAERIIKEARLQANQILNEQEILIRATSNAHMIEAEAKENASKLKKSSIEYVDRLLARAESLYDSSLATIQKTRRVVQGEKEE